LISSYFLTSVFSPPETISWNPKFLIFKTQTLFNSKLGPKGIINRNLASIENKGKPSFSSVKSKTVMQDPREIFFQCLYPYENPT
jgi:hypothetical protein